ncbi:MAG: type II toxin-antitoxin system RelE/ParE family toxin [Nitrospinae bacterium]|nr:type II toxin-antitoxin system RelE/ParE family toxin [Nitrospinota bacterium]
MIITIRHKGLDAFYHKGITKGLPQKLVKRIAIILPVLDVAEDHGDLDIPGLGLHQLKGGMRGYWAVSVSGNWRFVFRFRNKAIYDLDLVDYH